MDDEIKTATGVHPFDPVELSMIEYVATTTADDGTPLLTLSYASTVMPAMAEKIKQLRVEREVLRRLALDEVLRRMRDLDPDGLHNADYVHGWTDAFRTVERMRET